MARKSTSAIQTRKADLSPEEMKSGAVKIQRRLGELEKLLACNSLSELEQEAGPLAKKIDQTISDVFGADTQEYQRFRVGNLYSGGTIFMGGWGGPTADSEYVAHYHEGTKTAIGTLNTAKSVLEERLEDMGASPAGMARRAIEGLHLHQEIEKVAGQLYRDGHYSSAVLESQQARPEIQ